MNTRLTLFAVIGAFIALLAFTTATASAEPRSVYHGGTYGGSIVVEPGQVVDGDLNVLFGDATIEGTVNGDVNVVGGSVIERPGGTVSGHVNTIGGPVVQSIVPWAPSDTVANAVHQDWRIMWRIAWDIVVVVFFLIFPLRTRIALDRLEQHPALAGAVGLVRLGRGAAAHDPARDHHRADSADPGGTRGPGGGRLRGEGGARAADRTALLRTAAAQCDSHAARRADFGPRADHGGRDGAGGRRPRDAVGRPRRPRRRGAHLYARRPPPFAGTYPREMQPGPPWADRRCRSANICGL